MAINGATIVCLRLFDRPEIGFKTELKNGADQAEPGETTTVSLRRR